MKICHIHVLLSLLFVNQAISQVKDSVEVDLSKEDDFINGFSSKISTKAYLASEEKLPFWFYANKNGRIDSATNFFLLGSSQYGLKINDENKLTLKGGVFYQDGKKDEIQIDELYLSYIYKKFQFNMGVKHREEKYRTLSSVGGNILWSQNARSVPGLEFKTIRPIGLFSWLDLKAELAHYELNDDRFVENALIHYKSISFIFKMSKNQFFSAGLHHYAQYGGISPQFGKQPSGFKDYIRVFFGKNGGNTQNDQINTLGNHLGSYRLNYNIDLPKKELDIYYQSLFEDRSGRELNNFPDGVWGVAVQLKNSKRIKTVLLEYVQTVSQSGRPRATIGDAQQSGGDNYFSNSIYLSGWTYQGNIIGLPFITRNATNSATTNNRTYAFHAAAAGSYGQFDYSLKTTLVENLGTYRNPFKPLEKMVYTYGGLSLKSELGIFNLQTGIDFSNLQETNVGISLGYRYYLN